MSHIPIQIYATIKRIRSIYYRHLFEKFCAFFKTDLKNPTSTVVFRIDKSHLSACTTTVICAIISA